MPINVNYRYLDNELHYLLDNADVEALVFHTSLADRVARVRDRLDRAAAAGRGRRRRRRRRNRRTSRARSATRICRRRVSRRRGSSRDGDEVYIFYTGGTTGMPKGVMYPLEEFTRVLPAVVPTDDRADADRGPERAAGHRPAACSRPARRSSPCRGRR